MTNRHEDEPILDWLRNLQREVERLKKGDKGVRVNDTRLGDAVVTPNTYANVIEFTNLPSGTMTPIGSTRDITWSWADEVVLEEDDVVEANMSPPYVVPDDIVANEIVLAMNSDQGCATVDVIFSTGITIRTTLTHAAVRVRSIHVPIKKNTVIRVKLMAVTEAFNLQTTVRFGPPASNADNYTIDAACVPAPA